MVEILFMGSWFGLVACCWLGIVNVRTATQRSRLIDVAYADCPDWCERSDDFRSVSYYAHLWCLYRLGNPARLYSHPALVEALS